MAQRKIGKDSLGLHAQATLLQYAEGDSLVLPYRHIKHTVPEIKNFLIISER